MTKPYPTNSTESPASRETDILTALEARDESALRTVSRLYGRLLHGIALRITGNDSDAEECVNDALLDLWNAVPPAKPTRISAYVSALVRRRAIDRVRYNAAEQRAGITFAESSEELAECLVDPDGYSDCDSLVIRDSLQAFVDRLPEEDRRIFLLRYYRFESHETIAELCGLSTPAVAMRLLRLRKRLKKALEAEGIEI